MEALEHRLVELLTNLGQTLDWFGLVVIVALESANTPILSKVTMPLRLDAGPGHGQIGHGRGTGTMWSAKTTWS